MELKLPIKCNNVRADFDCIGQYRKMGIIIQSKSIYTPHYRSNEDDLFVDVILPNGWSKVNTDHPLWSKLIDDKNRVRATIFYKSAFYDRDAFINFESAIEITYRSEELNEYGSHVINKNNNQVLFDGGTADVSNSASIREKCFEFVKQNYPNLDINASWD